ncbi:unnamed protein product [Pleuronectes platessa]|uniref:Uncharacterized protein n=1 Tax=Pleuronectes platessa TaxID=8262 RepID=A0A9N7YXT8_PLEPL|nr:unnamed protein product [Pleuronectes platessa]
MKKMVGDSRVTRLLLLLEMQWANERAPFVLAGGSTAALSPNGRSRLIVQTSPSRLAGASAVTSPIHRSLDACQPGAARAVSMETSNKEGALLLHLRAARDRVLRTNPSFSLLPRSCITLKQRDGITTPHLH